MSILLLEADNRQFYARIKQRPADCQRTINYSIRSSVNTPRYRKVYAIRMTEEILGCLVPFLDQASFKS